MLHPQNISVTVEAVTYLYILQAYKLHFSEVMIVTVCSWGSYRSNTLWRLDLCHSI